nr:immunoglobulin heavy chain junction region [Mus musculus]
CAIWFTGYFDYW